MNNGKYYDYFGDIVSEAYNLGYELNVDDNLNVTLTAFKKDDLHPEIEVITHCKTTIGDNDEVREIYYFEVNVHFPDIHSSKFEFVDDMKYYLEHWQGIGELVTSILGKTIEPE